VQAAILAGGLAMRLRPLTANLAKAMLPIAGKPFLEHQLGLLRGCGIRDIVVCVGYLGGQLESYFGDGANFGVHLAYSREGDTLRGTGGALRQAEPLLAEDFVVLYGDSYLPLDYADLFRHARRSSLPATMVVYRNQDRWDRSNVLVIHDRVAVYSKGARRPGMAYIDAGATVLRKSTLAMLPEQSPVGLHVLQQELATKGLLGAYQSPERFYEIGSFSGLAELEQMLAASSRTVVANAG
jgi:NDP-sugar pyrophosphorylase family protein